MACPPRWYVAAALVALGRHRAGDTKTPFCSADLVRWAPEFVRRSSPMLAIQILLNHGYVAAEALIAPKSPCIKPVPQWRMTRTGVAAANAAVLVARAENPGAFVAPPPTLTVQPDPFAGRLWNLLRIRKALTAEEAASVLVDAGDEFAGVRRICGTLLLVWSNRFPDALQVSAKRVKGCKRYVLLRDLGSKPPLIPRMGRYRTPAK